MLLLLAVDDDRDPSPPRLNSTLGVMRTGAIVEPSRAREDDERLPNFSSTAGGEPVSSRGEVVVPAAEKVRFFPLFGRCSEILVGPVSADV